MVPVNEILLLLTSFSLLEFEYLPGYNNTMILKSFGFLLALTTLSFNIFMLFSNLSKGTAPDMDANHPLASYFTILENVFGS